MEQEQQKAAYDVKLAVSRHRAVPPGFVGLNADYGPILRDRRKAGRYGKQSVVAADIGISPTALSRIENGHTVPRLETLDALLVRLALDWKAVAIPSGEASEDGRDAGSRRRDRLFEAGQDIHSARRYLGLTLRQLASRSGISLAHLSRIERGANAGGLIYQEDPADHDLDRDERRIVIVHPVLADCVKRWNAREATNPPR